MSSNVNQKPNPQIPSGSTYELFFSAHGLLYLTHFTPYVNGLSAGDLVASLDGYQELIPKFPTVVLMSFFFGPPPTSPLFFTPYVKGLSAGDLAGPIPRANR